MELIRLIGKFLNDQESKKYGFWYIFWYGFNTNSYLEFVYGGLKISVGGFL